MSPIDGAVRIHLRAEVAQDDKRLGRGGVLVCDPGAGGCGTDKNFVTGELVEPDHLWAIKDEVVNAPGPLDRNDAVGDLG